MTRTYSEAAERILDAAEARFAEHGFAGTSLGVISGDVGIRAPSLYKHFESKRDLYEAVLERLLDPYVELIGTLLEVPEEADRAAANIRAVFDHYSAHPNLARLVQQACLAGEWEAELIVDRWFGPLFERSVELTPERGAGGSEPLQVVVAFHSLLSGYVTLAPLHGRLLGEDPLGPSALERQAGILEGIVRLLYSIANGR